MGNKPGKYLISVVGPTASGKTSIAIQLANWLETEIISADSRQLFREMNIGTAKPTADELASARHHFIDTCSIHDKYDVGQFERDVLDKLEALFPSFPAVVMAGGSGLYCKAVWQGLDEFPEIDLSFRESLKNEHHDKGLQPLLEELNQKDPEYFALVDQQNPQRIIRALEVIRATQKPFSYFRNQPSNKTERKFQNIKIGLELPRDELYGKIDHRMDLMIESGLFHEARELMEFRDLNALQTVGYTEIFRHYDGVYDHQEAVRLLKRNSRRYAKRQLTWFKKDPEIMWFHPQNLEGIKQQVEKYLDT